MPDKEIASDLSAALAIYAASWATKHCPGGVVKRVDLLSALIFLSADLIAQHQCPEGRCILINSSILTLVGHSNADVVVAVHRSPEAALDQALAAAEPAGRA